jgi:hypothetical protein
MASPSHPPNPITLIILGQRWSYEIFSYAIFSPCSKNPHYDYSNVTWHLDATFVHTGVVYQGRGQILWHLSVFRSVYKPDRWHQLQMTYLQYSCVYIVAHNAAVNSPPSISLRCATLG